MINHIRVYALENSRSQLKCQCQICVNEYNPHDISIDGISSTNDWMRKVIVMGFSDWNRSICTIPANTFALSVVCAFFMNATGLNHAGRHALASLRIFYFFIFFFSSELEMNLQINEQTNKVYGATWATEIDNNTHDPDKNSFVIRNAC